MSRIFTCPSCRKRVSLSQIALAVMDLEGPPEWWCRVCKQSASQTQWGKSADGIPAPSFFFYHGPAKSESFIKKLPRAITRPAVFAGSTARIGGYRAIHNKVQYDPDIGIAGYETVAIYHCAERYVLMGRYYSPNTGTADKVVLLLSGSGGVAAEYLGKVAHRYLKRLNVAVLLMDYRGFGGSDRKAPSEQGLFTDARAMFAYLTEGPEMGGLDWRPSDVVIHGYSLGTGVAAELAKAKKHCAGVILQCPFTSAQAMARGDGDVVGKIGGWLGKHSAPMDVINKIGAVSKPVLVLIANQDAGMKAHGDAIAAAFGATANFTVGRYDGEHNEPHNAFKDGSGSKMVVSAWTGRPAPRIPSRGEKVLKNPHGPADDDNNIKQATGQGCIGTIQSWFASL